MAWGAGWNADMLDSLQITTEGNRWGVIPYVHTNGVMEVGKYIDFHESNDDTSNYSVRLLASGGELYSGNYKIWHEGNDFRKRLRCGYRDGII